MNRREFLIISGTAAIAVPAAMMLGACGGGGSSAVAPAPATGDFVVTSTSVNAHTHTIVVRGADLQAGVQVTYTSSVDLGHSHTVTLTPAIINDINEGRTDNVSSSIDNAHGHDFPVRKP